MLMTLPQRNTRLDRSLLAATMAFATACGDMVCILPPRPAIRADIRDSITGAPRAFNFSLIVANQAVYDSTFFPATVVGADTAVYSAVESAPNGKPGIYVVRVRETGY